MGFKDNLRRKIEIDRLAEQVRASWGTPEAPGRIERRAMQALLAMSRFTYHQERDLDLYQSKQDDGTQRILVLDNELKLYRTTVADVALRKSPTVKEMVSIRNAIKILNDGDVVISRKNDTLEGLRQELIAELDLSFTRADLEEIAADGRNALRNRYAEGVIDILGLFAELLDYRAAPKPFEVAHCHIRGALGRDAGGAQRFGPLVIFSLIHNSLSMMREPISARDGDAIRNLAHVADGDLPADLEGDAVFEALVVAIAQGVNTRT